MPLIAVCPKVSLRAVDAPGALLRGERDTPSCRVGQPATYDWREPPGSPANTAHLEAWYEVRSLEDALTEQYTTEAHFVTYVVRQSGAPLRWQPKVKKRTGEAWMREQGYTITTEFFAADVDNPGHARWPDAETACRAARETLAKIPTAGVYVTSRGLRVVQPIPHPIDVQESEPLIKGWLFQIAAAGVGSIEELLKTADWTRNFRLPHTLRDGQLQRSPAVLLDRMTWQVELPRRIGGSSRGRGGTRRAPVDVTIVDELPEALLPLARRVAAAIREGGGYKGERHGLYHAIAGALSRSVPWEHVPSLVTEIAALAGAEDPSHHRGSAIDTIRRRQQELPVTGLNHMPFQVAGAIEGAVEARRTEPTQPTADDASDAVLSEILRPAVGLRSVRAQCGIGKTAAAIKAALHRAKEKESHDAQRKDRDERAHDGARARGVRTSAERRAPGGAVLRAAQRQEG